MILAFFSSIILFYALALLFACKIWKKLPELNDSGQLKSVSILIPFRNEATNLTHLLRSLKAIDYPTELLEVILINDHSSDDFRSIIETQEKGFPFKITILSLPEGLKGKKSAITAGIDHSSAEIILTSDADCQFPKDWVLRMQAPFEIGHIQLVSGSVVFKAQDFLSNIFQMEFSPLIGVGAVSIELGNPTMANGANLAFRRATFEKLNPYQDNLSVPSGDDVFLLQKMKAEYRDGIFFQKEAVVETLPPKDLKLFFRQRKRWAAKWAASTKWTDRLPGLAVWLFHLIFLTAIIYSIITAQFFVLLPVLVLKVIAEGYFISLILKSQNKIFRLGYFVLLQLSYSYYVLIFGLSANYGQYIWKERKYNSNERAGN